MHWKSETGLCTGVVTHRCTIRGWRWSPSAYFQMCFVRRYPAWTPASGMRTARLSRNEFKRIEGSGFHFLGKKITPTTAQTPLPNCVIYENTKRRKPPPMQAVMDESTKTRTDVLQYFFLIKSHTCGLKWFENQKNYRLKTCKSFSWSHWKLFLRQYPKSLKKSERNKKRRQFIWIKTPDHPSIQIGNCS